MAYAEDRKKPLGVTEGNMIILVGIPAFNEEKTIARVILSAQKYANLVVVCDDGSSDFTGPIAEKWVQL